jgi:hypothetical protein
MLRTSSKVHYEGNDRDFDTGIAYAGFARSAVINMWKPVPPWLTPAESSGLGE